MGAVFLLIAGALMVQFQELGTATAVAGVTTSAVVTIGRHPTIGGTTSAATSAATR